MVEVGGRGRQAHIDVAVTLADELAAAPSPTIYTMGQGPQGSMSVPQ